eukprot:7767232-Pyramimonas_sp.AAC.1
MSGAGQYLGLEYQELVGEQAKCAAEGQLLPSSRPRARTCSSSGSHEQGQEERQERAHCVVVVLQRGHPYQHDERVQEQGKQVGVDPLVEHPVLAGQGDLRKPLQGQGGDGPQAE